jgi:hypothetical protein
MFPNMVSHDPRCSCWGRFLTAMNGCNAADAAVPQHAAHASHSFTWVTHISGMICALRSAACHLPHRSNSARLLHCHGRNVVRTGTTEEGRSR